ncbi:glycosyltransferase family 4 protein [Psychrobium sp. 1_MG-2023]|uniref:glycosyltransferase family 4 protein n=1 Tax=Psychrobium sp. 1_MG-2023 TaxID=3062624 RepID=UPI000C34CBDD|nr:glycosyltransferase family 4 protein [Psychrobium sp. 1_MG-2023]MDP2562085.1 glycosyltransferase family 4 protein [Psychrobium sp. 1_MG-2023]PKF55684.1 hypothetical protein CW748_12585 [Alteromonadales bacterium alter-6D02]
MKRVLIVSNEYPPIVGGAGIYLANLVNNIDLTRHKVTLIIPEGCCAKVDDNLEVIEVKEIKGLSLFSYYLKIKELNLELFSKIIVNDPSTAFIFTLMLKEHRAKQVVFLHGLEPEYIFQSPRPLYQLLQFGKKYLNYLNQVEKVVFVSHDLENKFNQIVGISKLSNSLQLSPCVNRDDFLCPELAPTCLSSTEISEINNSEFILSVSRIEKLKGYSKLLKAVTPLLKKDPKLKWVVIGTGAYLPTLKRLVSEAGVINQVIILDELPRKNLSYFYSRASVFILLSEYRESFGLVYLEALSFGCNTIGNDYGGVSEILIDQGGLVARTSSVNEVMCEVSKHLNGKPVAARDFHEVQRYSKTQFSEKVELIL